MKPTSTLVLLVLGTACAARTNPSTNPGAGGFSETSVRSHMEFFASDAMNGRGSGTRDEWITATYIAAHLRRWGLEPLGDEGGYVQTIEIERPELGAAPVLSIGERRYVHGKEFTVSSMTAPRISGPFDRHQPGASAPEGAVLLVPALTREMTESVANAAIVLTRQNGCGGFRPQAGVFPRVSARTVGVPPVASRPACVELDVRALRPAPTTSSMGPTMTRREPSR